MRRVIFSLFVWVVMVGATPPQSADQIKAQTWVDLAAGLYGKADYAGALAELRRAEPLLADDPTARATVRYNIARCHEKMGALPAAVEAYERHLEIEQDAARKQKSHAAVARLVPRAFGTLTVTCEPATARVRVGDRAPVECGPSLRVAAGPVELAATAEGFAEQTTQVAITAGQAHAWAVVLEPARERAAAKPDVVGTTPAQSDDTWPWLGVAAGGALLATGLVTHVVAAGERDDAENLPTQDERDDAADAFGTYRAVTLTSYALGAALLGTSLYFLLDDENSQAQAGFSAYPGGVRVRW